MTIFNDFVRDVSPAIDFSKGHLANLILPGGHSAHLAHHRATVIIARIQLVSLIMAVVSMVFTAYAALVLPEEGAALVIAGHAISSLVFILLAWPWNAVRTIAVAHGMLAVMMAIGPLFWLGATSTLRQLELAGDAYILAGIYEIIPFLVVVSLSLFPLTILETLLQAIPSIVLTFLVYIVMPDFMLDVDFSRMLLIVLLLSVAILSGMGQLHYIVKLVNRLALDPETGAHTKISGSEALDVSFRLSELQSNHCAVAMIDLGDINDHTDKIAIDELDGLLQVSADNLRKYLRNGDQLVRWDARRFLVLLGNANEQGVNICMNRILKEGFARTSNGDLIVGNVGVAERITDDAEAWDELVDIAEDRLHEAIAKGRGLCQSWNGVTIFIGREAS